METTSLYIHIPFCTSKCSYCDFFSVPLGKDFAVCEKTQKIFENYVLALKKEISFYLQKFNITLLKSIYIGGGTPSLLSVKLIKELLDFIELNCKIDENAEITMEANPQDISEEFLEMLKITKVNRLSVGVQCYNDEVLKILQRRCDLKQVDFALNLIKDKWVSAGFSFSCDLISGLPYLSDEDFLLGLNKVISFGVNHISLYSLMVEEGTLLERQISREEVAYSDEINENQWILGRNFLEEQGFYQYEVSNFAKKGFESRHNTVYWHVENYLGCGAGATGTVDDFRWNNNADVEKYIDFWLGDGLESAEIPCEVENLSVAEKEFEFLMMGFRLREGVKASQYKKRFGGDLASRLGYSGGDDKKLGASQTGVFDKWMKKHLGNVEKLSDDYRFYLTGEGLLFLNQFLEEIL